MHLVQVNSVDPLVQTSTFEPPSGTFMVPGRTTAVFVLYEAPEKLIGDLIDQIEDLVDQGVINKGQGNSLIVKLEGAIAKLPRQPKVALNKLNAFINEVNSLYEEGVLPQETAAQLVMEAEIVIAAIEASMP